VFVSQRLRILTAGAVRSPSQALEGQAVAAAQDAHPWILMIALAGEAQWLREQ